MCTTICSCLGRMSKAFVFLKVTYNAEINKQNGRTYVVQCYGWGRWRKHMVFDNIEPVLEDT